jgi:hypothetical protein
VHGVPDSSGKRAEVAWYVVDPAQLPAHTETRIPLVQTGRIRHSTRSYFYPSLAVNGGGDVAFGFSGSSPADYIGAYAAVRGSSDPDNTTRGTILLKSGHGPYYKTFSGSRNRWGDFSATCTDPSDDTTFWTLQEYAATPDNTWGTWWGKLRAVAGPAPESLSVRYASATSATLSWSVPAAAAPAAFRVERRTVPGGDFVAVPPLLDNALLRSFADNGVVESVKYEYRVAALYGEDGALSSEVAYTHSAPSGGGGGGCFVGDGGESGSTLLPLLAALLVILLSRSRGGRGEKGTGIAALREKSFPSR